jgi:hypothetical protein
VFPLKKSEFLLPFVFWLKVFVFFGKGFYEYGLQASYREESQTWILLVALSELHVLMRLYKSFSRR